ncbi:hypothetical protein H0H92_005071 [Tricholoma furcatifolium]|nr:hypothetical protein H0H92_005071 [Tricholoma furcatifolium]
MPFIPDIVHEHLKQHSTKLVGVGASPSLDQIDVGHTWFFTPEMAKAVNDGDGAAVQNLRNTNMNDLKANMDLISKVSGDAFVTVTNPSDGQQYRLCASDNGWMWVYTLDVTADDSPTAPDGALKATVSCGTFTKSQQILGLSVKTIGSLGASITELIINGIVSFAIGKFISQRVGGALYDQAMEAATQAAVEGVEDFTSYFPEWIATASGFLGGMVGGIVVGIILLFLINYVFLTFGLEINVYNWSVQEEWDITDWYSDNALMQNPQFAVGNLPAVTNEIKMPDGTYVPTDSSVTSFATYTAENDSKFAEGLGMGFKVVSKSDSTRYFFFKYIIHWGAQKNQLGLGLPATATQTIADWYMDDSSWAPDGSMNYTITVPAGNGLPATTIKSMTPALSGDSSHYYHYDVHIGPQPSS